jgi:putative ABC transport system substrate-binding protein
MRRRDLLKLAGGVSVWPVLARAQSRGHVPRIAVLWHANSAEGEAPYFGVLMEGFESLGYTAGKAHFEHRFPDEKPELFQSMAAELVAMEPDVLVAVGGAAPYAKKATATIPIVFIYVPDPVGANLVENIRRPGGNATGLTNFSVDLRPRLEYLKELAPAISRVALLINPSARISELYVAQANEAGPKLGLSCKAYPTRTVQEIPGAFDAMAADGMQGGRHQRREPVLSGQGADRKARDGASPADLRLGAGSAAKWSDDFLWGGSARHRAPRRLLRRPHPQG